MADRTDRPTPKTARDLVLETWGKNVRLRRVALGWTQTAAAERAAVDQTTLSRIERGRYGSMTPDFCLAIAVALEADVAELFGWPPGISTIAAHEGGRAA